MAQEPISAVFCPRFHHAAELIGRRWTGAIVRALLHDLRRFGELEEAIPGLSNRMLSERLKELESEGIVKRTVSAETAEAPPRIEYALTVKGHALVPVVAALTSWAEAWIPVPTRSKRSPRRKAG
jgi:DNA-binding HxlR family transcriptional regulator